MGPSVVRHCTSPINWVVGVAFSLRSHHLGGGSWWAHLSSFIVLVLSVWWLVLHFRCGIIRLAGGPGGSSVVLPCINPSISLMVDVAFSA